MRISALLVATMLAAFPACADGPVVVELFTSQGCSSCPSADRLLSTWGADGFRGGSLLPLSFDVDYWNYLGWKDVFSAPAWSARQARYAEKLGVGIYTPQMVVAGRTAFVGSDESEARAAAKRFAGEPPRAEIQVSALSSDRAKLDVAIEPKKNAQGLHAFLALFETGLVTEVSRGENAGSALHNDFVVRRLKDLGALSDGKPLRRQLEESWDPSWKKERSGAAVFLQDPKTLAVYDARSVFPLK